MLILSKIIHILQFFITLDLDKILLSVVLIVGKQPENLKIVVFVGIKWYIIWFNFLY